MNIYYAHHLWKYNTEIEKYEIELIKANYPDADILNPNGCIGYTESSGLTTEEIMDICFAAIHSSDVLVFSSVNGVVGKGVTDEVTLAKQLRIPIFYIDKNELNIAEEVSFDVIPGSNSKRIYATVNLD